MNINSIIPSNTIRTVKSEPDQDNINRLKNELIQRKQEYEQEIIQLQKTHEKQIYKLCNELDKSSSLLHQYTLELDSMRLSLNLKEKQLANKNNELSSNQDSQTKTSELTAENAKLKEELSVLTKKYETLLNEMQDAREYVLKMIASLE
jgi:hypothetical protein